MSALVAFALSHSQLASPGRASAQGAAPSLSGTYRCQPEPISCQWSGQSFTIAQSGTKLDMKSDKGDVGQGLLSSNTTLSVGAPWNMLGVILPDQPHPMVERHLVEQAVTEAERRIASVCA